MANKKDKKDKKTRMSKIKSMVGKSPQGRSLAQYMKYKDLSKTDVHTGDATYRGATVTDSPGTNINTYGTNSLRGHGKQYFRFQGGLYKKTPGGVEKVTV